MTNTKAKEKELETLLLHMGMHGLAYTPEWNKKAKELNDLKKKHGVK